MINTFSITQIGKYHVLRGIEAQDYSATEKFTHASGKEYTVSVISDGVGSASRSAIGSKTAVLTTLNHLLSTLTTMNPLDHAKILHFIKDAFDLSYDAIEELSAKEYTPFLEYDCTLTAAVYDGETLCFGHIGDDGIVAAYEDGNLEMITTRHKGEEAHSLYPLRFTRMWEFGKREQVASFAMCTDGILDFFVSPDPGLDNLIYVPFIQRALCVPFETEEDFQKEKEVWERAISPDSNDPNSLRDDITDDMTLVIVTNSERVKNMPGISFNEDEYYEKLRQRKKEKKEQLYSKFYEQKQRKTKSTFGILADDPKVKPDHFKRPEYPDATENTPPAEPTNEDTTSEQAETGTKNNSSTMQEPVETPANPIENQESTGPSTPIEQTPGDDKTETDSLAENPKATTDTSSVESQEKPSQQPGEKDPLMTPPPVLRDARTGNPIEAKENMDASVPSGQAPCDDKTETDSLAESPKATTDTSSVEPQEEPSQQPGEKDALMTSPPVLRDARTENPIETKENMDASVPSGQAPCNPKTGLPDTNQMSQNLQQDEKNLKDKKEELLAKTLKGDSQG